MLDNRMDRDKPVMIKDVKDFWETHPDFVGESSFVAGSKEFFEEHRKKIIDDGFEGSHPLQKIIPRGLTKERRILDLGCGIGFWVTELQLAGGFKNIYAADLTQSALELTKKRLEVYDLKAELSLQNAEKMTFGDEFFDHVICDGVIHYSPDTGACIQEIARVLKKGGSANISVYYFNILLKLWPALTKFGFLFRTLGFGLKGRGRQAMFSVKKREELVRIYDGLTNPLCKYYSGSQIVKMVKPYFRIENFFLSYFPARALPFSIPRFLHKFLAKTMGFMIHLNLRKI